MIFSADIFDSSLFCFFFYLSEKSKLSTFGVSQNFRDVFLLENDGIAKVRRQRLEIFVN